MSVVITSACIACGACEWECPNEAICPGAPQPVVQSARCTECWGFFGEAQCIVVCPAEAIVVEEEPLPALSARFEVLHPGAVPQDTWVWERFAR